MVRICDNLFTFEGDAEKEFNKEIIGVGREEST